LLLMLIYMNQEDRFVKIKDISLKK